MTYIKGFYMSLGMFTRIPLPWVVWDEKLLGTMVAMFPLTWRVVFRWAWVCGKGLFKEQAEHLGKAFRPDKATRREQVRHKL